jgi:hypothetical protein
MHGMPAVGQYQPGSKIEQSAEQPSPATTLPSSQASPGERFPSPHFKVEVHLPPCAGQSKFGSFAHRPVQPSPGSAFPSSQVSLAWLTIRSPQ